MLIFLFLYNFIQAFVKRIISVQLFLTYSRDFIIHAKFDQSACYFLKGHIMTGMLSKTYAVQFLHVDCDWSMP